MRPRAPMRRAFARRPTVGDGGSPPRIALSAEERRDLFEMDVAVLALDKRGVQVRVIKTGEDLTVRVTSPRASLPHHIVPGQVATLVLRLASRDAGRAVGELRAVRVDVAALKLRKLRLHERGVLTVGVSASELPRIAYEMEQVLPWSAGGDPILASIARREGEDRDGAAALLVGLLHADLRCIDAHAHLGNIAFPACAERARSHYEVGVAIGDEALGPDFAGALPWSYKDNQPFLRCLHSLGLSLWRLKRMEEAAQVFERMLRLNPADQQSAGRCLRDVQAGRAWDSEGVHTEEE